METLSLGATIPQGNALSQRVKVLMEKLHMSPQDLNTLWHFIQMEMSPHGEWILQVNADLLRMEISRPKMLQVSTGPSPSPIRLVSHWQQVKRIMLP